MLELILAAKPFGGPFVRGGIGLLLAAIAGCTNGGDEGGAISDVPTGIRFLSSEDIAAPDAVRDDDADAAGGAFAQATTPREFEFPADHAAHPEYRSEWWYFTGNVESDGGRHYGFELTLFRFALAPRRPAGESAWRTNQVYMGHLAITDTQAEEMIAEERLTRAAVGLAGSELDPLRVWVESWSVGDGADGGESSFALDARGDRIGLNLELVGLKPPVAHGEDGLDPKGPEPGNASYYYSITRLAASGSVTVEGDTEAVQGLAWMDREWSTSALSPDIEGWDWFALQLSDGRDLMLYRLRGTDGSTSPFSGGSLVDAEGRRIAIGADDFTLEPLAEWESPRSGARYPVAWRLTVPDARLDLEIRPVVNDQEILLSVRYWEGAVRVQGRAAGRAVEGRGYLELAGYR